MNGVKRAGTRTQHVHRCKSCKHYGEPDAERSWCIIHGEDVGAMRQVCLYGRRRET